MGELNIFFFRNICFVDTTEFFHFEIRILGDSLGHLSKRGNCVEFEQLRYLEKRFFSLFVYSFWAIFFFVFFHLSQLTTGLNLKIKTGNRFISSKPCNRTYA